MCIVKELGIYLRLISVFDVIFVVEVVFFLRFLLMRGFYCSFLFKLGYMESLLYEKI